MEFLGAFLVVSMVLSVVHGDPLVPALCIFGDSVVDVGNNNNLQTLIKANFPPYGRDFVTHKPTGRFCNGKLATDFTAEYLGFNSYPPAYLSQEARGRNILTGVNFASAASGYYDRTAELYVRGIHLISAGSSDFIQNYYINPILNRAYSPDQFSDILMRSYSTLIQNLYNLGARRIGVTTLPPTGCLPAAITLFGSGSNQCVARLNRDAVSFNNKLNTTSQNLKTNLPGLKLRSVGTCSNATQYVFWDGFHPSESANEKLAQSLLEQDLISSLSAICSSRNHLVPLQSSADTYMICF
ncbi:hypothetical protein Pfo_028528 [Paulownia fortunei]|nr:hypothetical protein Pfo_028528 [Paulownia fortunei]